jgi:hypothetical protein
MSTDQGATFTYTGGPAAVSERTRVGLGRPFVFD